MRAAWAVFRKELLEAVRDRRTLLLGLLLPVIEVVAVRDPRAALQRGTVHAVLEASREESGSPVHLRVLYDEGAIPYPLARLAVVLGKFGTVFTLATTSVVLVVGTVILSLRLAPLSAAPTSLSGGAVVSLVGVGLVFAAFLSGLQRLLTLAAR